MELYGVFNENYYGYIKTMCHAFKNFAPNLQLELQWVQKCISSFGKNTSQIVQKVQPGILDVQDRIHTKDETLFENRTQYATQIEIFERSCLYDLFPKMYPNEKESLWISLQTLVGNVGLTQGTKRIMPNLTKMAQALIRDNPTLTPNEFGYGKVIREIFNNKEFRDAGALQEIFSATKFRDDMKTIVRAHGLGAANKMKKLQKDQQQQQQQNEENKTIAATETTTTTTTTATTSSTTVPMIDSFEKMLTTFSNATQSTNNDRGKQALLSAQDLFAQLSLQEKKVAEQTETIKQNTKDPSETLFDMLEKPMTEESQKELTMLTDYIFDKKEHADLDDKTKAECEIIKNLTLACSEGRPKEVLEQIRAENPEFECPPEVNDVLSQLSNLNLGMNKPSFF